jgi:hypothetical protein
VELLIVSGGKTVILLRKPKRYSKAIAGMGKEIYGTDYLSKQRESWKSTLTRSSNF